jgi:hypothetical protein
MVECHADYHAATYAQSLEDALRRFEDMEKYLKDVCEDLRGGGTWERLGKDGRRKKV